MVKKKRGLGKGLSALIPDEVENTIESDKSIINIDISKIKPNKEQPRRDFDRDSLYELSNSIKKHGLIQPIIVKKAGNGYEIIAGERRWRAAKDIKLKEIPCIIKEIDEIEASEIALIENIQREDLNPIEEGLAYKKLMDKYNLTQEKVSEAVGKSRSYIANITRLLKLDKRIIELISSSKISSGHGRTLLALEDKDMQYEVAKRIIENSLNVRDTERLVKNMGSKKKKKKQKKDNTQDPVIRDLEESLRKVLGTKVQIVNGRKKGKIEIEYYSDDDLQRILDLLSVEQ
ncbi:ParB/RepB/Spo0J family partition protein [Dethiothermospora halolimnae]|uniref:ParB/RepB/Spo0J family partition protein n=1 Tax=Dethiothermospora halolimnae TaxID=3114390 RepID=UPI003CCB9B75